MYIKFNYINIFFFFIESLLGGQLYSLKHESCNKSATFKNKLTKKLFMKKFHKQN